MFLHLHYYSLEVLLKCASTTVQFMRVFELGLQQEMHAKGILMNPLRSKLLFEPSYFIDRLTFLCVFMEMQPGFFFVTF